MKDEKESEIKNYSRKTTYSEGKVEGHLDVKQDTSGGSEANWPLSKDKLRRGSLVT